MKKFLILIILIATGCSSPSMRPTWESIELKKLNKRNGVYYKINSEIPYTGKFFTRHDSIEGYLKYEKKIEGYLKNGLYHGLHVAYYTSGQKEGETNWKEGKQVGDCTLWYKNGQKMFEGKSKDGKFVFLHGWDENGKKINILGTRFEDLDEDIKPSAIKLMQNVATKLNYWEH